jgi:hypothetical protein
MQLDNVTYINPSDYPEEMRDAIETLGGNLNSFMEQVVELSRSNIDFENTTQEILTFDVTVGPNGIPTSSLNIRTSKKNVPSGFNIISARNMVSATSYPNGSPFVSFTPKGNFFTEINHISNLVPNQKYRVTVIVY